MALTRFKSLITNLSEFDFGKEFELIVTNNADKIADLQATQLSTGKDVNGDAVKLYGSKEYSPFTMDFKQQFGKGLGAVVDRVTNYMSGDFYRSIITNVQSGVFEQTSNVPYFDEIVNRSGEQIMQLGKDKRLDFAEEITIPQIAIVLQEKTGLKL